MQYKSTIPCLHFLSCLSLLPKRLLSVMLTSHDLPGYVQPRFAPTILRSLLGSFHQSFRHWQLSTGRLPHPHLLRYNPNRWQRHLALHHSPFYRVTSQSMQVYGSPLDFLRWRSRRLKQMDEIFQLDRHVTHRLGDAVNFLNRGELLFDVRARLFDASLR